MSRDVRPPVQMRLGTRVSSRISTQDSEIPPSCQMKDEPAFKPLQGNPTLFLVRESRYPRNMRQQNQGPSYIPIAQRRLLLRCLWKVGSNLQSKTGNHISSWDDMVYMELSSSCCTDINIHIDLRRVSQGISFDSSRKSSD